jgi:hypothetical protein
LEIDRGLGNGRRRVRPRHAISRLLNIGRFKLFRSSPRP